MEGLEHLFYSCTHLHDLNIIFDIKKLLQIFGLKVHRTMALHTQKLAIYGT